MAENDFYIKFGSNAKTFSDELKRDLGRFAPRSRHSRRN